MMKNPSKRSTTTGTRTITCPMMQLPIVFMIVVLVLLLLVSVTQSFVVFPTLPPLSHQRNSKRYLASTLDLHNNKQVQHQQRIHPTILLATSLENEEPSTTSRRKQRTRRKVENDVSETTSIAVTATDDDNKKSFTKDSTIPEVVVAQNLATTTKVVKQQEQPIESVTTSSSSSSSSSSQPVIKLKPRQDSRVTMKVTNVQDLLTPPTTNGNGSTSSESTKNIKKNDFMGSNFFDSKTTTSTKTKTKPTITTLLDDNDDKEMDPLERMLLDARAMQVTENQQKLENSDGSMSDNDNNTTTENIKSSIQNVISTIVTVDFFVVCLFLLWFIAGIIQSYAFKDDTIQIAFNSNFQLLVQPALGILMIASLTDAIFKNKDEDEQQ